jgi:hypothetical protein
MVGGKQQEDRKRERPAWKHEMAQGRQVGSVGEETVGDEEGSEVWFRRVSSKSGRDRCVEVWSQRKGRRRRVRSLLSPSLTTRESVRICEKWEGGGRRRSDMQDQCCEDKMISFESSLP